MNEHDLQGKGECWNAEHLQLLEAFDRLNDDRNFWKKEHAGLMESYRFLQAKFDRADRVHNEEMGALEKERDFYVKAWERRGKALALPCLACGYTGNEIKMKQGETP